MKLGVFHSSKYIAVGKKKFSSKFGKIKNWLHPCQKEEEQMNYDNIPQRIKDIGQFCTWKYEQRKDCKTKVAYNPVTRQKWC